MAVTILCMAAATYATRAGGYLLFRIVPTPPVVRAALAYVPGALFVSYVVPALASGGVQQWVGALVTAVLMVRTGSMAAAILGGTLAAWGVWAWGSQAWG